MVSKPGPDFREVFESLPGLYLILDLDFFIVAGSRAYLAATATEPSQALGRSMFEVFPDNPADPAASGVKNLRASLQQVVKTGCADIMPVQKYDIPLRSGGGFEVRYWSPVNSPVFNADGALQYIIHRAEDVTEFIQLKHSRSEQDKLASSLRAQADQMEMEIFGRAQELQAANRQLQAANHKLDQLDRLKTQFFANVSHELRTPLTLILGPAENLLHRFSNAPEVCKELQVIQRNARTLLKQVNDLLDVSRLDAGKMTANYANVDLSRHMRLLVGHFEALARERRIACTVDAPQYLSVHLDADKIDRVLLNLLSNAFKFTPAGGSIGCRVYTEALDETRVCIEVGDSGPGIPPEKRDAVFERFTQLDGGADRQFGGTGLGLAIVRDFVVLLHGDVQVLQAPQGGALLRVVLPRWAPQGTQVASGDAPVIAPRGYLEAAEAEAQADRDPLPPPVPPPDGEVHPVALVVEDNAEMRWYIQDALRDAYHVMQASNGEAALKIMADAEIDVIITDMMMPGMTGQELLLRVRADARTRAIPVVFVTAKADEQVRIDVLRQGAQDYVMKPFAMEELRARVGNLAAIHRTRRILQAALDRSTTDLEGLARELAEHRDRERDAVAARDDFLAIAAHELRTPVTALLLQTQNLRRRAGQGAFPATGNRSLQTRLDHVQIQGRRLTMLIEEMLDVTRVDRQHIHLERQDVELNTVVRTAVGRVLEGCDAALQARVTVHCGEAIHGQWDPLRLEQIVVNLLSNGLKYGRGRPVEVRIGGDAQAAVLEFADQGIGIAEPDQQRIFERFGRAVSSRNYGGLGMGLYIVRQWVEAHGGSIDVRSEVDEGSTFVVTLPYAGMQERAGAPAD